MEFNAVGVGPIFGDKGSNRTGLEEQVTLQNVSDSLKEKIKDYVQKMNEALLGEKSTVPLKDRVKVTLLKDTVTVIFPKKGEKDHPVKDFLEKLNISKSDKGAAAHSNETDKFDPWGDMSNVSGIHLKPNADVWDRGPGLRLPLKNPPPK